MIEVEDVRFPHRLELAWGADPAGDPWSWVWTDESEALQRQVVTIRSGRDGNSSSVRASSFGPLELKNKEGRFTPLDPRSDLFPYVRRNTPLRYSVKGGSPHLALDGSAGGRAATPDHAALDITGDWFLAVEIEPPGLSPLGNWNLIGKFVNAGNQLSVFFGLNNGAFEVLWSPDGTAVSERSIAGSEQVPLPLWAPMAYAVWLDVNNGAGGVTATFYVGATIDAVTAAASDHVLEAVTQATTSSVFNSTAPLQIGDIEHGGFHLPYLGKIRKAQVRNGNATGTVVANPDFTVQTVGATGFTDSAGRVWTVTSPAEVSNWQTRFVGYVDEWAPTWPEKDVPGGQRVTVTASGPVRRLTQGAKPFRSAIYRSVTATDVADKVKAYWPFEDGSDSVTAASPLPGVRHAGATNLSFAANDTLDGSDSVASISSGTDAGWLAPIPVFSATNWRTELFVRVPTLATSPAWTLIYSTHSTGTVAQWLIESNTANTRLRAVDNDGGAIFTNTVAGSLPTDQWINIGLELVQNGGNIDWGVNWWLLDEGVVAGWGASQAGTIGRPKDLAWLGTGPSDGISWGHLVASTDLLGGGWVGPAGIGYRGERAGERVQRLCDEEGLPVVVFGDVADTVTMGPQRSLTLVDLLDECALADGGILCEQRHTPGIGFRTRVSLQNQSPVLDVTEASRALVNPFEPILDDLRLRNDVTVSRVDGSSARVVDETSVTDEGRYDEQLPAVNVQYDSQLPDLAGWALHEGTWAELRYPTLSLNLGVETTDRVGFLDDFVHAGPGDVMQVTEIPTQHPVGPVLQLMDGMTEQVGSYEWRPDINSSPAGPWEVGVRGDDTRGKRDAAASELNTQFVAGTGTSMSVATTSGPLWTTDSGEMPFDLNVGGVRLTVTAISGGSSPQTFTVTQTPVNGINKTIPAGTRVRLWRPTVRAR